MVCVERGEEAHAFAPRVEGAVAVEQALLVGSADDGAEAQVFVFLLSRAGFWRGHLAVVRGVTTGVESTMGAAGLLTGFWEL